MAFVDLGDQFLALSAGRRQSRDDGRHFGLVVDDKAAVRRALEEAGVELVPGRRVDFFDPWGNRVEVVDYRDIQFTKAPWIARGMGVDDLEKSDAALAELREKGLDPRASAGSWAPAAGRRPRHEVAVRLLPALVPQRRGLGHELERHVVRLEKGAHARDLPAASVR